MQVGLRDIRNDLICIDKTPLLLLQNAGVRLDLMARMEAAPPEVEPVLYII